MKMGKISDGEIPRIRGHDAAGHDGCEVAGQEEGDTGRPG
jgi:hypothetical protein